MCFFDSPVGRCEVIRELVLLDQTQPECAREHGCPPGAKCPLTRHFAEVSGVSDAAMLVRPPGSSELPETGDSKRRAAEPMAKKAEASEQAGAR